MELPSADLAALCAVSSTVDLRIMETTDLHMHLHPYDYYSDCPDPDLGLTRLSELIDVARQQVPNSMLFDNGDFLQGTPAGDFIAYERGLKEGDLHPLTEAMNALRYDAVTLGNHEFNYGLSFLDKALAQREFPVVSANILRARGARPARDQHYVAPYKLLKRVVTDRAGDQHALCIGVLGVAPPQITLWEHQALKGRIETRDMVEAAQAFVPQMREAGADLVVLLAHTGIGPVKHSENMENAIIPLAGIDGVDLILSGHSHQLFPSPVFKDLPGVNLDRGTICGTPVVNSGFFGSHLGLVDLKLMRAGGRWMVLSADVSTRGLREAAPCLRTPVRSGPAPRSPKVRKIAERAHQAVLENIRQPIGQCDAPINSFFVFLGQSSATALVAEAQAAFVEKRLGTGPHAGLPILSAVAPCKAGGLAGPRNFCNVQPGVLTMKSLADLYVFPNRIAVSRLTGAEILLWLERAASAYNQLRPGIEDQPLMDPRFPAYNFEIMYGLRYEIELSASARFGAAGVEVDPRHSRIRNATWQGRPLDPQAEFLVCTNSFRAYGAGGFAGAEPGNVVFEDAASTRDILRAYISEQQRVTVSPEGPFTLRSVPRATAILRTSAAAKAHLGLVAQHDPEFVGVDDEGFMRLKLRI